MSSFSSENKPLWEVVAILAIIIVCLGAYASLPAPIEVQGTKIKQSALKEYINPAPEQALLAQYTANTYSETWEKNKELVQKESIDSTKQVILLTGDSMCEGLMFRLQDYAKLNGHTLKTVIWYSSGTVGWSKTDSLRKLVKIHKPTYIFFTTGSNELFIRNIQEREPYIQNIIAQAGDLPFIWIGPPNWAEDTGINDLIVKNAGKDRYFKSKGLTFQRLSDGAHPTWNSAAVWADTVAGWVQQKARKKILLRKPKMRNYPY
jgi:hypothetical protein